MDIESSYAQFELGEVTPLDYLSLQRAAFDNEHFVALQQQALFGDATTCCAAADEILALAGDLPTSLVLDGIVSIAYERARAFDRALEARIIALSRAPSWHPLAASQILGNLGNSLVAVNAPSVAFTFYERALSFDPTNPFVLESLATLCAEQGQVERALALRAYLFDVGFPTSCTTKLDAALAEKGTPTDARSTTYYVPSLVDLHPATARDFARLVVASQNDLNTPPKALVRGVGIGAAMRGEWAFARLFALESSEMEWSGFKERQPIEEAWSRAVESWLADSGAPLIDPDARAQALEAALSAHDVKGLTGFLHDPIHMVRVLAAETLGDEAARTLLIEHDVVDREAGTAAGAPYDSPAGFALYRLRVRDLGPQPLLLFPPEGADHPVFEALGNEETLVLWATFPGIMTSEDEEWFGQAMQTAATRVTQADPEATFLNSCNGQTVQLELTKLKKSAAVVKAFYAALAGPDTRLRELALGCFDIRTDKAPLWHAKNDPRYCGEEVDQDEWWDRSFDLAASPPQSEPHGGPSFILISSSEGRIPEVRLMRAHFDDVRVCHGLADVDGRPDTARDADVAAALQRALGNAFRGLPPEYFNKDSERNGLLDAITSHGRIGYAFAFSGLVPEFIVHYPACFRCREHEMTMALREVIEQLGLAPVIHWYRDAGTWIYNLWENRGV